MKHSIISVLSFSVFLFLHQGEALAKRSCPNGYTRTATLPSSDKACKKPGETKYVSALLKRKNTKVGQGCKSGEVWDVVGGDKGLGACYSCPSGYTRNANPITASNACEKVLKARYTSLPE